MLLTGNAVLWILGATGAVTWLATRTGRLRISLWQVILCAFMMVSGIAVLVGMIGYAAKT